MTDFVRRLVSGNKARFKDEELDLELDLVYVTDQIIIMGYPASGMEGLYRNRREDAIRFLEHRHGNNYWVYNFCPIKENSYEASIFGGRVSRYPFPDHHAPPLAIMPLVAREIDAWLKDSKDRVAVLHCKAGKGRSGTMACTYLLAHNKVTPPELHRSYSKKELAKHRMEETITSVPPDDDPQPPKDTSGAKVLTTGVDEEAELGDARPSKHSFTDSLKGVLDLHTARRMKPASEKVKDPSKSNELKTRQGVSIPSQRRFLYYWALLLSNDAPKHLWAVERGKELSSISVGSSAPFTKSNAPKPKVRLTQIRLRMRETSSMKLGIVKAANKVIERTGLAKGPNAKSTPSSSEDKASSSASSSSSSSLKSHQVWVSLARYDDGLIELLEDWEVFTRSSENMATRRPGSEHLHRGQWTEEEVLKEIFASGKWDKGKMVRSFARLGVNGSGVDKIVDEKDAKVHVYTLNPLTDKRWEGLKHDLITDAASNKTDAPDPALEQTLEAIDRNASAAGVSRSEANSVEDITTTAIRASSVEHGVILDAGREIRVKLYMGQVFMGWVWFVPTFHMPQPPPTPGPTTSATDSAKLKSTLRLTRADVDFPLGLGADILDVEIDMEWVVPKAVELPTQALSGVDSGKPTALAMDTIEPPLRARTEDSTIGTEMEPSVSRLTAVVQAVTTPQAEGGGIPRQVVEGKQAED